MNYEAGARGPKTVDCWGLLYLVYQHEFGIFLPLYPGVAVETSAVRSAQIAKEEITKGWTQIITPIEGCAVAMSQRSAVHHVGIYTEADGGKILHCWDLQSVVADTIRGIKMKGMKSIAFYRHTLWPT